MTELLDHLRLLANKKIALLGFAREGQSTYRLLRQLFPNQDLWILDERIRQSKDLESEYQSDPHLHVDSEYLSSLRSYDRIFKTPSVPIRLPQLQAYLEDGGQVTTQLQEFLSVYRSQVVGVTGTKGKSTTASLIAHILQTAQRDVILAGNIGSPIFDHLNQIKPETIIVLEVSSYQLETIRVSPHVAVLLSLFPEHLDYHQSYANYVEAKSNISRFQTPEDWVVYNQDVPEYESLAQGVTSQKLPFSPSDWAELQSQLDPTSYETLPKVVQEQNLLPAIRVARNIFQIPPPVIEEALRTFRTLPHRLQDVGTYKQISFYDDTLATIPEASMQALESLPRVDLIILGGFDRGITYDKIVQKVIAKGVPHVLLFRPSGEKMRQLFQDQAQAGIEIPSMLYVTNMNEVAEYVFTHLSPGAVVLLSPASPSFGDFKNYEDKSHKFITAIREYASK